MQTVLDLMMKSEFTDCIVVQGAPGAGKSTFTKKLCSRLRYEGLIPIRIPLQHLRVDANIFDAIQDVVCRFAGSHATYTRRDLLPQKMFSERVVFGKVEISPYVLIFDGWDEISLSAEEGFQQRIERLLDGIRQTFLDQNRVTVRVVLTGRPSQAVGRANFLRDETPILTIRAIRPEQLNEYVKALQNATDNPTFSGEGIDGWKVGSLDRYDAVLEQYSNEFPKAGTLEVLGQPLLAHLAFRVMANFEADLKRLISSATTLYRHLVDLTCRKGGKHPADTDITSKSGRIGGSDLRVLLHGTALAINAYGQESIPSEELELRLETLGVGREVFQSTKQHPLANLMISFYFKGGAEESGCEFLHKSFREYLTAEGIVELLKQYGRSSSCKLPERVAGLYWQDFQEMDPRRWLIQKLGEALSPQWVNRRIMRHVSEILKWEVTRAAEPQAPNLRPVIRGAQTQPIEIDRWELVRDGLVDIWDWWGEGVHLRQQPKEKQRLWQFDDPSIGVELVKLAMRRSNYRRTTPPRPPRIATIDANLGYALFQLNALVHSHISEVRGWAKLRERLGPKLWRGMTGRPRRYQVTVSLEGTEYVLFAPSGASSDYFRNYVLRINGAGVGPGSSDYEFPAFTFMRGLCFEGANLDALQFEGADMTGCNLARTKMCRTAFGRTLLSGAEFSGSNLFGAHFIQALLDSVDLTEANLYLTDFRVLSLHGATGLTTDQLFSSARGPVDLELPQGVRRPNHWRDTNESEPSMDMETYLREIAQW